MTNYEKLVQTANLQGINIYELNLGIHIPCGKCIGNCIIINAIGTAREKYCVLAEELGHYKLTSGNISDQSKTTNRKQEIIARRWGYETSIGLTGIVSAFEHGCVGKTEISEYLGVTEDYLQEAVKYFKSKYGIIYELDCYVIYFEPSLGVMKKFEFF